jgi:general stress protein 26
MIDTSFDHKALIEPAERLIGQFASFAEEYLPAYTAEERRHPSVIHLPECPKTLLDAALDDMSAHTLIIMGHIARTGHPFQTVLGFHYMDKKIHVMSRANAAKIKLLRENPKCSFIYHNNVASPSKMACMTLTGRARVIDDHDYIERANANMMRKAFRDSEISPGGIEAATKTMNEADRRAIVLDEIDGVWLMMPAPAHLPSGLPLPVVSWRADQKLDRPSARETASSFANGGDTSELAQISSLIARLNYARDDRDMDRLLECWTEDAEIHFTDPNGNSFKLVGRDAIEASARRSWALGPMECHFLSNPAISIDGERAEAHYYTLYPMPAREPVIPAFGTHQMLVRRGPDGRWRVCRQVATQYAQPEGAAKR